jgi:hypothetical protein
MTKVAGSRGAGPIWHNFLEGVFANPEMESQLLQSGESAVPQTFTEPPGLVRAQVCALSGMKPSPADTDLINELFIVGSEPKQECDLHQLFKICIAPEHNGQVELANPYCPTQYVIERPYLVLPDKYTAWGKTQKNLPLAPTMICDIHGPEPTATPTPSITETPVPGVVGPIDLPNPTPLPTPPLDDAFPGAVAMITSPRPGAGLGGQVTITGSASANDFNYYKLEYGQGNNPTGWVDLNGQNLTAVRSGILGVWNTADLPEGPYILRLTLVGTAGEQRQYRVAVRIERTTPTVRLVAPGNGSPYFEGDTVIMTAEASGPQGVVGVEFLVDGVRMAVVYNPPYVANWIARPGDHTLTVLAYSPTGRRAGSPTVNISVTSRVTPTPAPPPDFKILLPVDGSTVASTNVPVLVAAAPDGGFDHVDFYVDGWKLGQVAGHDTFSFNWQTIPGKHTILAIGIAADGHEITRAQVTIFVPPR